MQKRHVVIGGGGVGALEAALALKQLAGDRVRVELIAPNRYFVYRALSVGEPTSANTPPHYDLEAIADRAGIHLFVDTVERVDARVNRLITGNHRVFTYDKLVLAVGARAEAGIPGAVTFAGAEDVERFSEELERLRVRGKGRVAFVVPRTAGWTLPVYELALMTEEWGREHGVDLDLTVITREGHPLGVFGVPASEDVVALLEQRGITLRTGTFAEEVEGQQVHLELEGPLEADLVVSMPHLAGPAIPGLPHDEDGFVAVDEFGRLEGERDIYAIGDMTTRPLKQGGLAAQQADVAATHIAAELGVDVNPEPYKPALRGLVLTGEEPRFLRRVVGEDSSESSQEPLWWPAHKISAHYLAPFLDANSTLCAGDEGQEESAQPGR